VSEIDPKVLMKLPFRDKTGPAASSKMNSTPMYGDKKWPTWLNMS
jgi:hypothetical protein